MMNKYTPISCATYSQYELTILRRRSLRVCWLGPKGSTRLEKLKPVDLRTRSHAEFMIALNQGGERKILRLDRIIRAEEI